MHIFITFLFLHFLHDAIYPLPPANHTHACLSNEQCILSRGRGREVGTQENSGQNGCRRWERKAQIKKGQDVGATLNRAGAKESMHQVHYRRTGYRKQDDPLFQSHHIHVLFFSERALFFQRALLSGALFLQ